jgi:hypothetical protein
MIIYSTLIIFGLTTILGLYLSSLVLRNKQTPKVVIAVHGVLTLSGFVFLIFYCPATLMITLCFSIATILGLVLLYQDLTGAKFSKWLCYAHGFMTIAGFVLLFVYAVGR